MWTVEIPSNVAIMGIVFPVVMIIGFGVVDALPFFTPRNLKSPHLHYVMILFGLLALACSLTFLIVSAP